MKKAFTLAEVLITLAIIGIVAAMTIPTLLAKINDIVATNQTKVFKAKLIKGLNLTKTAGDLNDTYTSTYDFLVNGLGKNLKMVKMCDKDHIRDCIPYDKIIYERGDNKESYLNLEDIDSAKKLNLQKTKGFTDVAAFVLSDGIPAIVSYNLKCIEDPDKADVDINGCLAGIYDLNGARKPNKIGKDLNNFNGASIRGMILTTIAGIKIISNVERPKPIKTNVLCDTSDSNQENWTVKSEYSKYGITKCYPNASKDDYWAGAMIDCQDSGGRLPTETELTNIAQEFYNDTSITTNYKFVATLDTSKIPEPLSALGSSGNWLWSGHENDRGTTAQGRYLYSGSTFTMGGYRDYSGIGMVCVTD